MGTADVCVKNLNMIFKVLVVSILVSHTAFSAILKRIQTGTLSLTSAVTRTAVIDAVDPSKSFVLATGSETAPSPRRQLYTIQLTNGTLVTATRSQTNTTAYDVRFYVVEFLRGVSVQRGLGTISTATVDTAITSVGTLSNAFVLYSYRNNNNAAFGTDDFTRANLTSTTNLRTISQAASTSGVFEYQVVTYDQVNVQRGAVNFAAGDSSRTATVSSIVPAKTWLYYNCDSANGTAANIGQKGILGVITDSTTLTFSRVNTGQTMNCDWQAISFSDRTQVQSGVSAFAAGAGAVSEILSPAIRTGNSIPAGGWINMCGSSNFSSSDTLSPLCALIEITSTTGLNLTRRNTTQPASIPWSIISFSKRRITFQD